MRPAAALLALQTACAAHPAAQADASPPAPVPPVPADSQQPPVPEASPPVPEASPPAQPATPPPADPPSLDLLGQPRETIEARLGPPQREQDGWTLYPNVALQYRSNKSVALRRTAPAGLDCLDIPAWAGITPVGFPLRRTTTCEWPGLSERHMLAPGLTATLDLTTRQLEIRQRN